MNEVGAKEENKQDRKNGEVVEIEIHIGVFFDGTNNNANTNEWTDWFKFTSVVEKNHAYNNTIMYSEGQKKGKENEDTEENVVLRKNSNPAILSKLFFTKAKSFTEDQNAKFLHLYIEGSGTNGFQAENSVVDFLINGKAANGLGFGMGPTGVVAKVSKAVKYVAQKISKEEGNKQTSIKYIHFYVFGFSRGSACARLFSFLVARSAGDDAGLLKKDEKGLFKKNAEVEFDKYLTRKYFKKGKVSFLDNYKGKMSVDFLGIYDTVSAIGFLKEEDGDVNWLRNAFLLNPDFWDNFHKENVDCYGLFSPNLEHVKSTCHICALDEFRANFALTDLGKAANKSDNIELLLPGCHSDIGGGYTDTDYKKDEEKEKKTLKKIYEGKTTRMCVNNPTNSSASEKTHPSADWKILTTDTLNELGWVDDQKNEIKSKEKDNGIVIDHYPLPRNQYSNIPLKFMYERALKKAPYLKDLFDTYPELYYPIPKSNILQGMWKDLEANIAGSGRLLYLIGGSYNSKKYKSIRQRFLHFTSTDSMHSAGDIGNPPGRRDVIGYSDICRLIYHGNKGDNAVHYMQDYGIDV